MNFVNSFQVILSTKQVVKIISKTGKLFDKSIFNNIPQSGILVSSNFIAFFVIFKWSIGYVQLSYLTFMQHIHSTVRLVYTALIKTTESEPKLRSFSKTHRNLLSIKI